MFMIFYNVAVEGMAYATRLGNNYSARGFNNTIKRTYLMCGVW